MILLVLEDFWYLEDFWAEVCSLSLAPSFSPSFPISKAKDPISQKPKKGSKEGTWSERETWTCHLLCVVGGEALPLVLEDWGAFVLCCIAYWKFESFAMGFILSCINRSFWQQDREVNLCPPGSWIVPLMRERPTLFSWPSG